MRVWLAALLIVIGGAAYATSTPKPSPDEKGAKKTCQLGAFKYKENSAKLIGCPAEVQALIDRALMCQHWTGEEPYDEARGHEIETAITELKCDVLSLEHDRLLKKYKDQHDVRRTLQEADREYNLEF